MSDRPAGTRGPGGWGRPVEKPRDSRKALRSFAALLIPHRRVLMGIAVLTVASTAFSLAGPKLMGDATTLIVTGLSRGGINFPALVGLLLLLGTLSLGSAVTSWGQQVLMAVVSQRVVTTLRTQVHTKLTRLPLSFLDRQSHGDILSRVTNDVDLVATTLQQSLSQVVTSTLTVAGTLVMMLVISPLLTLIALVVLPLVVVVVAAVTRRSRQSFSDQQKALGGVTGHVEASLTGLIEVRAYGREQAIQDQFESLNQDLYRAGRRAQFLSGLMFPLMTLVNNLGFVVVCVVGGFLAAARTLSVGDVQAFLMYLRQFGMPLAQTAGAANLFQSTLAAAERVFALLDEPEVVADPVAAPPLPPALGRIVIRDLHFRYHADRPLLEGLDLRVDPGQLVAIVGVTGAGKTTLVNLLLRFYDLDSGTIELDGVDVTTVSRSALRRRFGMVLQDPWVFQGTIRENLLLGRAGATEQDMKRAAIAAHADHFIRTLPRGYETELREDAAVLSSGQVQLLTIARALLADPSVLILDEATSSVDTRTERSIQSAMKTLIKGRTSFVIAHRLSTIREADLILVMDKGQVVEQGRHEDLLVRGGVYAGLYAAGRAGGPIS